MSEGKPKGPKFDFLFKVVVLGDTGVGKSSLLLRFCEDKFRDSYITTIGVDFKVKMIDVDGKRCKLQLWDTAGQERFRTITESYYRGAHGILICFDITSVESFENVNTWVREIDRNCKNLSCVKVLVGTKADLESERAVTKEKAEELAGKMELTYFETSSKSNMNVEGMMENLAIRLRESQIQKIAHDSVNIAEVKDEKSGCC